MKIKTVIIYISRLIFHLTLLCNVPLLAQSTWTDWTTVYGEGNSLVQISFRINGCGNHGVEPYSFWRTNNTFARPKAYIRGKFDYETCSGGVGTQTFQISLEKPQVIADGGAWFMGARKVLRYYDVKLTDYSASLNTTSNNQTNDQKTNQQHNSIYNQWMDKYVEALRNNQDDEAYRHAKEAEKYVDYLNREDFNSRTKDFLDFYEKKKADEAKISQEESQGQEQLQVKQQEEKARIEQEKQEQLQKQIEKNNADQKKREEEAAAATATQIASMGALGVFIYKHIGPEYDRPKNKFNTGSWRFNFSMGYSTSVLPVWQNTVYSTNINGTITEGEYTSDSFVFTPNLDMGFQFWPYYSKRFGLGIVGSGQAGILPVPGGAMGIYSYDYGGKVILGVEHFKLAGIYQMGDRGFQSANTNSSGNAAANTADNSNHSGEGAAYFKRVGFGPRVSFLANESIGNLEVLYYMEEYSNMKKIKSSGIIVNYYAHNRLRVYAEGSRNAARHGLIKSDLLGDGEKNNGFYFKLGVVKSMDWFGQKR